MTGQRLVPYRHSMEMISLTDRTLQVRAWITTGEARQLREAAGLSQSVVAQDCEVTQGAVLRWEKNERMPRGRNLVAYHRFLAQLKAASEGGSLP